MEKKTILVVVAIIGALGFLVASDVLKFPFLSLSTVTSNNCVISANKVRYDYSGLKGDKAWVIENLPADCSETLVGGSINVNKDDLKDGEKSAKDGFTVSTYNLDQWFEQEIGGKKSVLIKPEHKEYECGLLGCGDDVYDKCDDWQDETSWAAGEFSVEENGDYLHCVRMGSKVRGHRYRIYNTQNSKYSMDIKNCVNGQCANGHIETGQPTDTLELYGDRKAIVEYTGQKINQLTGIDVSDDYVALKDSGGNWVLGTMDHWDEYEKWVYFGGNDLKDKCQDNPLQCSNYVLSQRAAVHNLLLDATGLLEDDPRIDNAEIDSDGIKMYSDVISFPSWRLVLSADNTWLGVRRAEVKPQIQDASTAPFRDDARGHLSVKVLNDGNGDGSITVQTSCPDPISGGSETHSVSSGETRTFGIDLSSGSVEDDTTRTCTVEAMAGTYSDDTDVDVTVKTSCPDADGDEICDQYDECKHTPGPANNNGCPPPCSPIGKQKVKECPNGKTIVYQKCADPDNDGVGEWKKTGNQCPGQQDSDGDGVSDSEDLCANTPPGTEVNEDGCEASPIPWKWIVILAGILVGGAVAYKKA